MVGAKSLGRCEVYVGNIYLVGMLAMKSIWQFKRCMEMFISIWSFFIEQFGQHKFNCLIGEFGLAIIMWAVCCKSGMFEQKTISEDLNGCIDKDAFLNH